MGAGVKGLFGRVGYYMSWLLMVSQNRSWLRLIGKHVSRGCLLDVGCGLGRFLRLAGERYHSLGFDVSKFAVVECRRRGSEVLVCLADLPAFQDGSFDVVACFDVLEHVRVPSATIERLAGLLRPDGILAIRTPLVGGVGFRILKARWYGYLDDTHVSLLPRERWVKFLQDNSLEIQDVFSDGLFFIILGGTKQANAKALFKYLPYFVLGNLSLIAFSMGLRFYPVGENLCIIAKKVRHD